MRRSSTVFKKAFEEGLSPKVKEVKALKETEAGKVQRQVAKPNLTVAGSLFRKHRRQLVNQIFFFFCSAHSLAACRRAFRNCESDCLINSPMLLWLKLIICSLTAFSASIIMKQSR